MNPYTRAHVTIPEGLSQPVKAVLIRNIKMLYHGEKRSLSGQGRYVISTNGQWELEIETKLRMGVDYAGRLSIHCYSPKKEVKAAGAFTRRTHHWH